MLRQGIPLHLGSAQFSLALAQALTHLPADLSFTALDGMIA